MSSDNDIPIPRKTPCVIDEEPGKKACVPADVPRTSPIAMGLTQAPG